ncbi:MAG: hypothetical protein IPP56_11450 [Bacteroidetes bacterium]|nr:hypothetical protein [Bacteroidota bacterium]MBK9672694.1 hypothetical protein [Bacteroidota bacterium]MBK9800286.1 hypothetical protein [Bacteroidota bacterium]MBP6412444.1 hypothetical protein [Bacteroidia bacterium]
MEFFLTDIEIDALIKEEKRIDQPIADFGRKLKEKKGHKEFDLVVERLDSSAFKIIIRQSIENPLDFSAILGFIPAKKTDVFLLRRYNGKSHEHRNKIEKEPVFYDFHIHIATARYQEAGPREEYYAEITDRYSDLHGAIDCLVSDCNIISNDLQGNLFTQN